MDKLLYVKPEPEDLVDCAHSELHDQQTIEMSSANRDILPMRLIKKEEQSEDMIGEELIGTCDVEEPKVEQISEDELEITFNSEKSLNEMSQTEFKKEAESDDPKEEEMLTAMSENGDRWEPQEKTNKQFKTVKKNSKKLRKILNYMVEKNDSKLSPNKCYICKTDFASSKDLKVHLPEHAHMVPYECAECKVSRKEAKIIFTVNMLHRHFRMHAGSIKCPECAFRTTCAGNGLYRHIKMNHLENTDTVYTCEVCGEKLKNVAVFENHLRMHKAVEAGRYTCEFCAKKFATKARLEQHKRIHTNERPYQCHDCNKSFINETTFHAHERSHIGERGFRCDDCGKSLRSKRSFLEHMASHSNIRPYSCTVCGTSFVRERNLEQHMLKHSDELSYECQCGKKFRYSASLNKHKKIHTEVAT